MIFFDVGEIAVCGIEAKKAGVLRDPDSLKITIYGPDGKVAIGPVNMVSDSEEGKWHYDFATVSDEPPEPPVYSDAGEYLVTVQGMDGTRPIIVKGSFILR